MDTARARRSATFLRTAGWRWIGYWTATLFIAYENVEGAIWSFLRTGSVRVDLAHLGYPLYFLYILGMGEICIAVALLTPRAPVAKEWAYAGACLNYTAAVLSHLFVGDWSTTAALALVCLALAVSSRALRPPDRRPRSAPPTRDGRAVPWLAPALVLVAFAVIAVVTLPHFTAGLAWQNLQPMFGAHGFAGLRI